MTQARRRLVERHRKSCSILCLLECICAFCATQQRAPPLLQQHAQTQPQQPYFGCLFTYSSMRTLRTAFVPDTGRPLFARNSFRTGTVSASNWRTTLCVTQCHPATRSAAAAAAAHRVRREVAPDQGIEGAVAATATATAAGGIVIVVSSCPRLLWRARRGRGLALHTGAATAATAASAAAARCRSDLRHRALECLQRRLHAPSGSRASEPDARGQPQAAYPGALLYPIRPRNERVLQTLYLHAHGNACARATTHGHNECTHKAPPPPPPRGTRPRRTERTTFSLSAIACKHSWCLRMAALS
jgi:hypothetical protein